MKKLYLLLFAIAGFAMQAKAGVSLTHVNSTKPTGGENAPLLIDGDKTTKWGQGMNNGDSKWIIFKATMPLKPTSYTLTIANDTHNSKGRNWQKWRIYGGNFASDAEATTGAEGWVLLDFKSDITEEDFPTDPQYQATDFTMSEPVDAYYQYFLIYVDEIRSSGQYMQMGEFAFKDYTVDTSAAQAFVSFDYTTGVDADLQAAYTEKLNALNAAIESNDPDQIVPAVEAIVPVYNEIVTLRNGGYIALDWTASWGDGPGSNLVDQNADTKWGGNFPDEGEHVQYVVFRTPAQQPFFYKLVTGGDTEQWNTRNWKTWKVFGGNFASEAEASRSAEGWVVLDERENISTDYLPNKNKYPATLKFTNGVSTAYSFYKVEVTASGGSQQQMSDMYLCSEEEFNAIRQPLIDGLAEFAAGLDALEVESDKAADKATFAEKYAELKNTTDADQLTILYNELVALQEELEASAAFVAGDCYRPLYGNTEWGDNENYTKLVDGDITTKWGGGMPEGGSYVIFKTYAANTFNQYMLVTGNDTKNSPDRNWKTWKIYGMGGKVNDSSATRESNYWELIDEKTDIGQDRLPGDNFAPAYFNFTNPKSFKYFKIEVEAAYDNGGSIQMSEFKLLSDEDYADARQEYVTTLQTAAMALAALDAEIDLPAEKKEQLMAQLTEAITAKITAVATAAADDLLPAFNDAMNYITVEVPAIVAQAQMPDVVDGVYQLARAKDLANFAAFVNAGENEAKAVLTADIDLAEVITADAWTSIGNNDVPFKGEFDGQGYTIKNITYTATGQYNGLFGKLSTGAVVKNFTAEGTMTVSTGVTGRAVALIGVAGDGGVLIQNINSKMNYNNQLAGAQVGGILGGALNGNATVVDRCTYSGKLDGNDAGGSGNYGGIAGYANNNAACYLTISNCLFDGELVNTAATPGNCTFGGMVGYSNGANVTIKNVLSIGTVQSAVTGMFFGAVKSTRSSINNSYYQGDNVNGSASTVTMEANKVTDEQLASGEVVLNLGIAFRQDLGVDAYPTLDATKPVVVKITDAGYATLFVDNADVTAPEGVTAYTAQIAEGTSEGGTDYQYLALTEVEGGAIPATTPVILKGAEGVYEFVVPGTEPTIPDGALGIYDDDVDGSQALVKAFAEPIENNVLKGAADDIDAAGKYVLAQPEGMDVCFYQAESGTIKAGKAYLELDSSVKAFYFLFPGEDPTGIANVEKVQIENGTIYNVAGQRLQKMQKGINIVSGKKILF